jgi:hypothetical protein
MAAQRDLRFYVGETWGVDFISNVPVASAVWRMFTPDGTVLSRAGGTGLTIDTPDIALDVTPATQLTYGIDAEAVGKYYQYTLNVTEPGGAKSLQAWGQVELLPNPEA